MLNVITSPALDDLLLDVATAIELSDRDRRVAEKRYRLLKEHLERPESQLAPYLIDNESRIYPQGSMATGTTVVSGIKDDRFDIDALVEINVPSHWTPKYILDLLYEALKDFPDVKKVVRCTRCVQLQFAFMHMDVTIMDPAQEPRPDRIGEIFHSSDTGEELRVPANPFGFSAWFRDQVGIGSQSFSDIISKRRVAGGIDRLYLEEEVRAAEQDDLPPMLPPRLDSEQVVALKLLKRFLVIRYEDRDVKRPPSIYLSKLAADLDVSAYGLTVQFIELAKHIRENMLYHINMGQKPDERNPRYEPDRLNDRWPENVADMEVLEKDMSYLLSKLQVVQLEEFKEIGKVLTELFGERVSQWSVERLLDRDLSASLEGHPREYEQHTGTIIPAGSIAAPAIKVKEVPQHNFHCGKRGEL